MKSQVVDVLGRNQLTEELLRAGLEVSLPVRDGGGIDLIAYAEFPGLLIACLAPRSVRRGRHLRADLR
jgi:hypothetical protein